MTCVVGLVTPEGVVMGADSAGVAGLDVTIRADRKVFRNGQFVMGFTSSFRMGQILRYDFTPPIVTTGVDDLERFMVSKFVPAVRAALKVGGYMKTDNGVEQGGTFLVAVRNRLFAIQSDNQVAEAADGYAAVGCGDELARGALHATRFIADPRGRVEAALEAAAHHSAGVCAPFHLLETNVP